MTESGPPSAEAEDHGEIVERSGVRLSWAWIFPVLAAAAAIWLFWSQWKSRGPEIEIQFEEAPGLQAGKTQLTYRGVDAGKVIGVKLEGALSKVIVNVRLKAFATDLARDGTLFWIDQPMISLDQISGLDAIIQGNSIHARMGNGPPAYRFSGLGKPPLTPLETPALVLRLRAPDIPFLTRGAPVYHRGLAVGSVEDKVLGADGLPFLHVVIDKEHRQLVQRNSRFWSVPASSVQAGPGGVRLDIIGLAGLLRGGIAFDVFGAPGEAVENGAQFELFANERAARCSAPAIQISFEDGRGLLAGQTQVCYRGLPIGLVEKVWPDPSNDKVEAVVRLEPVFDGLRNADAVFTLIRPRISLEGVSGLDTLIAGVYIECVPGEAKEFADRFVGRTVSDEEWNRTQGERNGRRITLMAKEIPSIAAGAPVIYRGIVVGRVKEKALDENREPQLKVVIRKEFERAVRRNARFWRLPATSVQAGPGVLKVDVAGLDALLQGGVQFDVFGQPGGAAEDEAEFELFANERAARSLSPPLRIAFENGQGLLAGQTQLRYRGVPVGLVEKVNPSSGKVEVVARLEPGYDFLRGQGTIFSLVRPRISLEGVSGLEALVSGVYIDCLPGSKGKLVQNFVGRSPAAAAWQDDQARLEVVITTPTTSISVEAPLYSIEACRWVELSVRRWHLMGVMFDSRFPSIGPMPR